MSLEIQARVIATDKDGQEHSFAAGGGVECECDDLKRMSMMTITQAKMLMDSVLLEAAKRINQSPTIEETVRRDSQSTFQKASELLNKLANKDLSNKIRVFKSDHPESKLKYILLEIKE